MEWFSYGVHEIDHTEIQDSSLCIVKETRTWPFVTYSFEINPFYCVWKMFGICHLDLLPSSKIQNCRNKKV